MLVPSFGLNSNQLALFQAATANASTQTSAGDRVEALAAADHATMAAVLQPSTPEQFMAEIELFSINEKYGASSAVSRKRN